MRLIASVNYRRNGGSGFNLSYSELMEMEVVEILWWQHMLAEYLEKESAAIKGKTQQE